MEMMRWWINHQILRPFLGDGSTPHLPCSDKEVFFHSQFLVLQLNTTILPCGPLASSLQYDEEPSSRENDENFAVFALSYNSLPNFRPPSDISLPYQGLIIVYTVIFSG